MDKERMVGILAFEILLAVLTAGAGAADTALNKIATLLKRKNLSKKTNPALKQGDNLDANTALKKQLGLEGKVKKVRDIDNSDFGAFLRKRIGDPLAVMLDPHAHHILFKKGLGAKQQALVKEGQDLLKMYDIDPLFGKENLAWAPNRIKGQHDIKALQQVIDKLKETDEFFGTRDEMVEVLKELAEVAAKRR
ncbi:hypothetical protein PN836_003555 [Ningiella sp. W23]|uniref:hypothetical protein n=1 Tax=Ningiella sp. W23 TaxID=3023715 RepID=UPI003756749F